MSLPLSPRPDVLLLVGKNCPHCHTVSQILQTMREREQIADLTVINVNEQPEQARALGVKSVPWMRIGTFEFQGLYSEPELLEWINKTDTEQGLTDYFEHLLAIGNMREVERRVADNGSVLRALLALLIRPELGLQHRLGISAVVEGQAGTDTLKEITDYLGELSGSDDSRVRCDVCYYLGLTHSPGAQIYIKPLLNDGDEEVREIARESLALMQ